jgi:CheY-like chemotaxis protein
VTPVAYNYLADHMKGGRIILVASDSSLRSVLCKTLAEYGHEATGCSTAQEALATIQQKPFDIILVDSLLPEMADLEMLKGAQAIDPLIFAILMVSNGSIQAGADHYQSAGVFGSLAGPFQPEKHLVLVNHAIQLSRLRRQNAELSQALRAHELSRQLLVPQDDSALLNNLADAMLGGFEVDELSIMLLSDNGHELHVAVVRGGDRDHLIGHHMPITHGIAGWVARNKKAITLHGEVNGLKFAPIRPRADIRCSVLIPILKSSDLFGVLSLNAVHRRPFTLSDIKAIEILVSAAESGLCPVRCLPKEGKSA